MDVRREANAYLMVGKARVGRTVAMRLPKRGGVQAFGNPLISGQIGLCIRKIT
jgi:hypothetical protein